MGPFEPTIFCSMDDISLLKRLTGCRGRMQVASSPTLTQVRVKSLKFVEMELQVTSGDLPQPDEVLTLNVDGPMSRMVFSFEIRSIAADRVFGNITGNLVRQPAYESARVEVDGLRATLDWYQATASVQVLDISREGMGICTTAEIRPGNTLRLTVYDRASALGIVGTARYCRSYGDDSGFNRVGIELHLRSRTDLARWLALFERTLAA